VVFIGFDETDVDVEFGETGGFKPLDVLVDYNCEELDHQEHERFDRIQGGSAPGDSLEKKIRIAHRLRDNGNGNNGYQGSKNNGEVSPREYATYITEQARLNEKRFEKKKAREKRVKENRNKKKQKRNGNKGKRG